MAMGNGGLPLIGALIAFIIYFANVALGAAGLGAPLGDVAEMLLLFLSSILFVVGVLAQEAAAARSTKKTEEKS